MGFRGSRVQIPASRPIKPNKISVLGKRVRARRWISGGACKTSAREFAARSDLRARHRCITDPARPLLSHNGRRRLRGGATRLSRVTGCSPYGRPASILVHPSRPPLLRRGAAGPGSPCRYTRRRCIRQYPRAACSRGHPDTEQPRFAGARFLGAPSRLRISQTAWRDMPIALPISSRVSPCFHRAKTKASRSGSLVRAIAGSLPAHIVDKVLYQ
jgi:hypothetical protein